MKARMRKFTGGGSTDPLEEYNKGENLDTTPGPKARRDSEDVVDETGTTSKFRRNTETGDLYSEEPITRPSAPKAKPKTIPPSGTPGGAYRGQRAESAPEKKAEIPKSAASAAPKSTGENTSGPSNMDRIFMGLGAGAGVLGAAKLAQLSKTEKAAKAAKETAKAAASKFSSPQARQTTSETGRKFGPKAEMEAAESTMRGAVSRKDIQAKRAAKERAESAEAKTTSETARPGKGKNIFARDHVSGPPGSSYRGASEGKSAKRTGSTGAPRSRNTVGRDEEMTSRNFAKGGKVRGGGCERRGKTVGKFV